MASLDYADHAQIAEGCEAVPWPSVNQHVT